MARQEEAQKVDDDLAKSIFLPMVYRESSVMF